MQLTDNVDQMSSQCNNQYFIIIDRYNAFISSVFIWYIYDIEDCRVQKGSAYQA